MTGIIYISFCGRDVSEKRIDLITSGSVETAQASFTFDDAWDGFTKTAVFSGSGTVKQVLLDESGTCDIPWEVLVQSGMLEIGVIGQKGTAILPSVKVCFCIADGTPRGEEPEEPTPSVYESIVQMMQKSVEVAQSVRDDADNGKFKGDKGDKGDKGVTEFATFEIVDGELYAITTDDLHTAFSLNNGHLEVTIE